MARIEFEIRCFDRMLIIEINEKLKKRAEALLETIYEYWVEGSDDVWHECCEEYMCNCLQKAGLEFTVIEEV